MSDNPSVVEQHGCIVCGKVYSVLVVYMPDGQLLDCIVTSGDGHRVPDARRPLVACDTHPAAEVEAAYARLYSDHAQAEDKEPADD